MSLAYHYLHQLGILWGRQCYSEIVLHNAFKLCHHSYDEAFLLGEFLVDDLSLFLNLCVFFFLSLLLSLDKIFSGKDKIWKGGGQNALESNSCFLPENLWWEKLSWLRPRDDFIWKYKNKQTKNLKPSTLLMTSQFWWASLVAQTVRNPPAMWETWVRSLGREDPLKEGMAIHSSILAWRILKDRGAWRSIVHGVTQSRTWLKQLSFNQVYLICFQSSSILFSYSHSMKFPKDPTTWCFMRKKS